MHPTLLAALAAGLFALACLSGVICGKKRNHALSTQYEQITKHQNETPLRDMVGSAEQL